MSIKPKLKVQLELLCKHFCVLVPKASYNTTDHGIYHPSRKEITLAAHPGPIRTHEVSMLHEFSHYLAHMRTGTPQMHRVPFKEALWEVTTFWYGDPMQYPWHTDFPTVEKYAKRRSYDFSPDAGAKRNA